MGAHFTQYFATVDKGYYDEENLDVSFNFGDPQTNPVKMVTAGMDEIGLIGSPETLLIARSKGMPVKAIATFHRNSDFFVIVSKKESNIKTVKDLEGKKVGFFYGHSSTDIIRHLVNKYNVNVEEVNVGQDYSQFAAGKLDAQFAFRTIGEVVLPAKGFDLNIISPADYGINTHGLTLFATEKTIKEKPELIEKFLRATFKGTEYTLENPEQALQSVLRRDSKLNPELQKKQLDVFTKPMSNSEEYPIGYMDYEMYKETYDRLKKQGLLEKEFDVREAFTTEFLDKIHTNKEAISVRLPIPVVESAFTPFYSAVDKGYYDDENLKVTFNLGSPETNPIKMVASGADDFGVIGGPDTLLVARSKGNPLVAIAVVHRNSNFPVILTLKDSGLTKLKDLDNKKIGFFYGHISTDVLHNLLNKYSISREEIDVGFDYSQLIAGKIDAEWAFRTTAGLNLPYKGIEVNTISPKDYGIITHGYTIFTTEEMIENNPKLVRRFLEATIKGIEYTLENPDKALQSTLKRSSFDPELERKRLELYNEVTSNSEEYPIGYMDYELFKETYDRLIEEDVIENEFDVRGVFTTEFLEKI
jgi:ABC-type nitrate/sulfonate/bicarbonate transport system substrate-binding protein